MIGIVTMEHIVVKTYSTLDFAASLSYNCAIEVTVAHAGVMQAKNTVNKIFLPSATMPVTCMPRNKTSNNNGYTSSRSSTVL